MIGEVVGIETDPSYHYRASLPFRLCVAQSAVRNPTHGYQEDYGW
jgi:hypothetical protein